MNNLKHFLISFLQKKQIEYQDEILSLPVSSSECNFEIRYPIKDLDKIKNINERRSSAYNIGRTIALEFFNEIKDTVTFDLSGHFFIKGPKTLSELSELADIEKGTYWLSPDSIVSNVLFYFTKAVYNIKQGDLSEEQVNYILDIFSSNPCFSYDYKLMNLYKNESNNHCSGCGNPLNCSLDLESGEIVFSPSFLYSQIENRSLILLPSSCSYTKEDLVYSTKVNLNSGRVVFANDLRFLISNPQSLKEYINKKVFHSSLDSDSLAYKKLEMEYYSNLNIMFSSTSNSVTNVFQNDSGFIFKNDIYYDEDGNEVDSISRGEEDLGSISMDVWCLMGMDYDLFSMLCLSKGLNPSDVLTERMAIVADVEPGYYFFKSKYEETKNKELVIYASLEK